MISGFEEVVIDNIPGTSVKDSSIHAKGLFAKCRIPAGTILCVLDGQVLLYELVKDIVKDIEWNALTKETVLVRVFRTKFSYVNHSKDSNVIIASNPCRLMAKKVIQAGEEILLDYLSTPISSDYIKKQAKFLLEDCIE